MRCNFYPRSPCGERPWNTWIASTPRAFLSTLSLRRATSIECSYHNIKLEFLSTLSLRRATHFPCTELYQQRYFYPRSPCGERLMEHLDCKHTKGISIHALLAESDNSRADNVKRDKNFYPRSPCGERPPPYNLMIQQIEISIHALLAESDRKTTSIEPIFRISIHALLAESDANNHRERQAQHEFLSTLSLRRATTEGSICFDSRLLFLSTLSLRRATPLR